MEKDLHQNVLACYRQLFQYYRELGEKAMSQLRDEDFQRQPSPESNSVAVIVRHLSGNMLSRFTDFLTTDGEKPWRERDAEFEEKPADRQTVLAEWQKGWECFFEALNALKPEDLE